MLSLLSKNHIKPLAKLIYLVSVLKQLSITFILFAFWHDGATVQTYPLSH